MSNNNQIRKYISILFMCVFFSKMVISVMPLFSMFDSKLTLAVIMQLEHENKAEKGDIDKDVIKEKKAFDDHLISFFEYRPIILQEINVLHNLEKLLLVRPYHPVVPTPPPNA